MSGSLVVLIDVRLGAVLPAAALGAIRAADEVYAGTDLPADLVAALGVPTAPELFDGGRPVVVIAAELTEPSAAALFAAGASVLGTPAPSGAELLSSVAVMDRLRSPGGCPWDAEQTHESLRRYLVEETYELLEAIEDGDRPALREELGDVLLQVLFHARIAEEDGVDPFGVDDVAADLVGKLVGRHPHVFAGGDPSVRDSVTQQHRWEELKQAEKQRQSSVDGVALGQPSVSLAAKLTQRATRAGVPADLLPGNDDVGPALFAIAAAAVSAGLDPEGELRAAGLRFAADLRAAEAAAADAGVDPLAMDAHAWRKFWPR
ncbi:MAG TPA: MazG family protein [Pseudonocardiaceae bacterium]|nr:MazG family protein [Pseudonocardiaceae bacterium]